MLSLSEDNVKEERWGRNMVFFFVCFVFQRTVQRNIVQLFQPCLDCWLTRFLSFSGTGAHCAAWWPSWRRKRSPLLKPHSGQKQCLKTAMWSSHAWLQVSHRHLHSYVCHLWLAESETTILHQKLITCFQQDLAFQVFIPFFVSQGTLFHRSLGTRMTSN